MNKKDTNYYYVNAYCFCSYCHTEIMPYDIMDEYGGYCGSYYQCECEQAQIEYQMNEEIEQIKIRYSDKLKIDYEKINRNMFKQEVERLKENYEIEQTEEDYYEEEG